MISLKLKSPKLDKEIKSVRIILMLISSSSKRKWKGQEISRLKILEVFHSFVAKKGKNRTKYRGSHRTEELLTLLRIRHLKILQLPDSTQHNQVSIDKNSSFVTADGIFRQSLDVLTFD